MFGQVLGQDGVVVFSDVLDYFFAMLLIEFRADCRSLDCRHDFRPLLQKRPIPKLVNRQYLELCAEGVFEPDDYLLLDEIDHSDEGIFLAEGKLQRDGVGTESLAHGANTVIEIGSDAVHLVDEGKTRNAI